jgi:hypothetical protein
MSEKNFLENIANYHPIKGNRQICLSQIIKRYSDFFAYDAIKVCKTNQPRIINLFQGFAFEEVETDDFSCLNDFTDHIYEVICNCDDEKYDYFMNWWANIFQNITVKNGTMPIIHGSQGSGKSFPIEVFGALLGINALSNVDDLDKVFGKFNGLIANHLAIIINEPPEADEKFKYLGKIKSKITQKKRYVKPREWIKSRLTVGPTSASRRITQTQFRKKRETVD